MFETTYGYIYKGRLRERLSLSIATLEGASKVREPGREYAVGLENNLGRRRSFFEALKRARALKKRFPDRKVVFRAYNKITDTFAGQVRFVTLSKVPPVASTPGVEGIDRIVGWLEAEVDEGRLKSRRYAGICVCKATSSGGRSDHADCAAIDIFASEKDMETIRDFVLEHAAYFSTKYVILYSRIWFPDGTSKAYFGNYHAHVHISVTGGVAWSAC